MKLHYSGEEAAPPFCLPNVKYYDIISAGVRHSARSKQLQTPALWKPNVWGCPQESLWRKTFDVILYPAGEFGAVGWAVVNQPWSVVRWCQSDTVELRRSTDASSRIYAGVVDKSFSSWLLWWCYVTAYSRIIQDVFKSRRLWFMTLNHESYSIYNKYNLRKILTSL